MSDQAQQHQLHQQQGGGGTNNESFLHEQAALHSYEPPGGSGNSNDSNSSSNTPAAFQALEWVYNPSDGSILRDNNGKPVSVNRILATKPLKSELSTRPGPGNKKLTYLSGDGVTRTLNDIFGYNGWNLDITQVTREECIKDPSSHKYSVVYTARVKLTHRASGSYREECGTGDAVDKHFGTAVGHALKGSITDAMKRAARQFGDKLGNSLYDSGFTINKAPVTLKDALDRYDIERANTKFGFAKDQNYTTTPTTTTTVDVKPAVATATVQPVGWQRNYPPLPSAATSSSTCTSTRRILPPSAPQAQGQTPAVQQLHKQPNAHQNQQQHQKQQQQHPGSTAPSSAALIHPTQPPPTGAMPPPTPTDSLRNSGLFSFPDTTNNNHHSGLLRPKSSHGRSSLGPDARPIPPPPLVTPTNASGVAAAATSTSTSSAGTKRPASQSIMTSSRHHPHHSLTVDPTATKKVATSNPYGKF